MKNKKKILVLLCLAVLLTVAFSLIGCNGIGGGEETSETETVYYTVKFDSNGGSKIADMKLKEDELINRPDDPVYEGYIFAGWYEGTMAWDFDEFTVEGDMTLKAKWVNASTVYSHEINEGGTVTITGYKDQRVEMAVPSMIEGLPVTHIADEVFTNVDAEKVFRIILPETVTHVGNKSFAGCAGIEITVKGGLLQVGEHAFLNCDKLTEVHFGEGMTTVSYGAFSGCLGLKEVFVSDSVTLIDENAFEECEGLVKVVFGSKLEKIGDGAFRFCDSLQAVFYRGTSANDYENIEIEGANDALEDASVYIYSETKPATDAKKHWHFDDNGQPRIYN